MNSGSSDRTPGCFLNQNWERSVDHISQFGSFMSPQSSSELERGLQRLDHLSEEILPQSHFMDSSGNSQALGGLVIAGNRALAHLDQFPADPGFAARAARFSSFDGQSYGWFSGHFELPGSGKPSTAAIIQSLTASGLQIGHLECNRQIPVSDGLQSKMNSAGPAISREETSLSDPISASNAKKRKAPSRSREKGAASPKPSTDPPKVADEEDSDTKRCRSSEKTHEIGIDNVKPKLEQNDGARSNGNDEQKQRKEGNDKPCEPPKDYIHVRARRGQATDSHSLAERVRREKISQRMKLLQDLVPGCKVHRGPRVRGGVRGGESDEGVQNRACGAPQAAVAWEETMRQVVRVVADAVRRSQDLHIPPWRKSRYMIAKWLGPYRRTTKAVPASPGASVSFTTAAKGPATPIRQKPRGKDVANGAYLKDYKDVRHGEMQVKGNGRCCDCTSSPPDAISTSAFLIGPSSSATIRHRSTSLRRLRPPPSRTVPPRRLRSLPPRHRITATLPSSAITVRQADADERNCDTIGLISNAASMRWNANDRLLSELLLCSTSRCHHERNSERERHLQSLKGGSI
ncbi:hypothetical protein BHM03_00032117 [Ensete ventricosum]|nr:hypothetical protein BHM03_00032117 [Ensete ventricosum]